MNSLEVGSYSFLLLVWPFYPCFSSGLMTAVGDKFNG